MTTPEKSALLAHLRDRLGTGPENLTTQALAFILNQYEEAREAFAGHCRVKYQPDLPSIAQFETQVLSADDNAIPDLIGTGAGRSPLMVEVKFHAGLTPNQPVTYIKRVLKSEPGGLLLFLVPEKRAPHIWEELKARCQKDDCKLDEAPPPLLAASHGNIRIGVASWSEMLRVLEAALVTLTDQRAYWELQQLRSLCDYEDRQVFEPLDDSDLQRRLGRRIGEYRDLAFEVVQSSLDRNLVDWRGPLSSSSEWVGRYFRLKGWQCWLGVHWGLWASQEHQSPIWLFISDQRAADHPEMGEELRKKLQSRDSSCPTTAITEYASTCQRARIGMRFSGPSRNRLRT